MTTRHRLTIALSIAALCAFTSVAQERSATRADILLEANGGKPPPVLLAPDQVQSFRSVPVDVGSLGLERALDAVAASLQVLQNAPPGPNGEPAGYRPIKVGEVWTIVPRYARRLRTDFAGIDVRDCLFTDYLLGLMVRTLTETQITAVSGAGLARGEMTEYQRGLWDALMRRGVYFSGYDKEAPNTKELGDYRKLDGTSVRLLLRTTFSSVVLPDPNPGRSDRVEFLTPPGLTAHSRPLNGFDNWPLVVEALYTTPLEPKPSQLPNMPGLRKAVGVEGVVPASTLLDLASRRTGLRFLAYTYPGATVWLGSPEAPLGDVLAALAVAADCTWRLLGKTCLLTGSLKGSASVESAASEASLPLFQQMEALRAEGRPFDPERLAALPADQQMAPGPTPEQLAAMRVPGPYGGLPVEIPYADLTPEQKEALKRSLASLAANPPHPQYEPLTEAELARTSLRNSSIAFFLDIPGLGVTPLQAGAGYIATEYDGSFVPTAVRAATPADPRRPPVELRPVQLITDTRGVAVPPLDAAGWERLLDEMVKRGLNTVYAPVLWDGKAMLPTKGFPLQSGPALPTLLREAAKRRIRVVAAISVLAWRNPSPEPHWLDEHPDWVERDVQGRTRRQWTLKHGLLAGPGLGWDVPATGDFVSPASAEVRDRLRALLDALARQKGLSGVALDRWSRIGSGRRQGTGPPRLGYTAAARERFCDLYAVDPVDFGHDDSSAPGRLRGFARDGRPDDTVSRRWLQQYEIDDRLFLQSIQARCEDRWPGAVAVFARRSEAIERSQPVADILVSRHNVGSLGIDYSLVTAPPGPDGQASKRLVEFHQSAQVGRYYTGPGTGCVLDFTSAPDLLWDGLALIEPPADAKQEPSSVP